jgi:hypothetical protein
MRDVLPDPVGPTTATSWPFVKLRLSPVRVGGLSGSHVKSPCTLIATSPA